MTRFAARTQVPVAQTQQEIQILLRKFGATGFVFGEETHRAFVCFKTKDRCVKMVINLPDPNSPECTLTPSGDYRRTPKDAEAAYFQAIRQRWRSLLLRIKARLEEIQDGQVTFDEAFLPYLLLPNGQTMMQWAEDEIPKIFIDRQMPALLPGSF